MSSCALLHIPVNLCSSLPVTTVKWAALTRTLSQDLHRKQKLLEDALDLTLKMNSSAVALLCWGTPFLSLLHHWQVWFAVCASQALFAYGLLELLAMHWVKKGKKSSHVLAASLNFLCGNSEIKLLKCVLVTKDTKLACGTASTWKCTHCIFQSTISYLFSYRSVAYGLLACHLLSSLLRI